MDKLKNDRVVSVLTKDGKFRIAAINNTKAAQTAAEKHELDFLPAFFLSRQLAAASMLAVFLKGEERMTLETDSAGPIKKVFVEAIQVGEVRGFVDMEPIIDVSKMKNISEALGLGLFKISKTLYNMEKPYNGVVELQTGNITSDLAYYFTQSEQIPTAVILEVMFDDKEKITASGGIIIQAMPGASHTEILETQLKLLQVEKIRELIANFTKPEIMLKEILGVEFDILKNDRVDFFCRCSKDNFMDKLVTLKLKEIVEMKSSGDNELVCRYCNAHYYLDDKDFDKLITIMQTKQN